MPRSGCRPRIRLVPNQRAAARRRLEARDDAQTNVDLPQPEAPIRQTNSPLLTREVRVAQRVDAVAVELELLVKPLSSRIGDSWP